MGQFQKSNQTKSVTVLAYVKPVRVGVRAKTFDKLTLSTYMHTVHTCLIRELRTPMQMHIDQVRLSDTMCASPLLGGCLVFVFTLS